MGKRKDLIHFDEDQKSGELVTGPMGAQGLLMHMGIRG